jgi:hypothetical protein
MAPFSFSASNFRGKDIEARQPDTLKMFTALPDRLSSITFSFVPGGERC